MPRQRIKSVVFETTETFETQDCAECGIAFALTSDFIARRREDGKGFYCPNGHSLVFNNKKRNEERIAALERELKNADARTSFERDQRKATERSLAATKGHVTRLRKHVQAGLCPYGCRRHFDDLEHHIQSKHAGEALPGEAE